VGYCLNQRFPISSLLLAACTEAVMLPPTVWYACYCRHLIWTMFAFAFFFSMFGVRLLLKGSLPYNENPSHISQDAV
jgi:hypothetical protein